MSFDAAERGLARRHNAAAVFADCARNVLRFVDTGRSVTDLEGNIPTLKRSSRHACFFSLFCSLEKRLGYQGQWSKWVHRRSRLRRLRCLELFSAERTLLLPATKSRLRGSASIFPPRRTSPILVTERTISLIAGMNLCTPPETGFMPASFCNTHALTTRPSIYNRVFVWNRAWEVGLHDLRLQRRAGRAERGAGFGV